MITASGSRAFGRSGAKAARGKAQARTNRINALQRAASTTAKGITGRRKRVKPNVVRWIAVT